MPIYLSIDLKELKNEKRLQLVTAQFVSL